ncbi:uncharacterized protein MJAP1_003493 [Malassezia japonica]|uniref:J domain-containing protein n=1 Tax=Malassezia japonica TaxID=223818 RepID=A0AAF0F900_9BASI|nr:uncharacterized protein MJAP1_003493 [Malassezia japonica]WFD40507.1 hypothetical protein MJAP1_003493 [Malassezia japonica]
MSTANVEQSAMELRLPDLPPKPEPPALDATLLSRDQVQEIIDAYERREQALEMHIAALSFEPHRCLALADAAASGGPENGDAPHASQEPRDPVLGVRLLQRMDVLQKENDDLTARMQELIQSTSFVQLQKQEEEIYAYSGDDDPEPGVAEQEAQDPPIYYPDFSAYLYAGDGCVPEPSVSEDVEGADEASDVWHLSSVMGDPVAVDAARLPKNDALLDTLAQSVHLLNGDTEEAVYRASGGYEQDASVSKSASASDIKSQYYDLVKTLHPDRAASKPLDKKEYERRLEKFRSVVKAYDLLKDPKKRAMYDKFGMGWEFDVSSVMAQAERQRYTWAARGQFRPRTQAEWDHWHMWSEVLRRTHTRGHGHAWQKAAQGRYSADGFYGFPEMSREEAERRAKEAMPLNQRVYMAVFVVAWILAIFQIQRVNYIGMQEVEASARRSQEVAKNLEMARENARSTEGQVRQRALMERVRQQKMAREPSTVLALPPIDTQKA